MGQRIKKNDQVKVIAGKDKGKTGRVLAFAQEGERVFIEKVNVVKRHTRPTQKNPQGGVVEKEASIHISNVMPLDPKSGQGTRVGFRRSDNGKKERYSKKSSEVLSAK